MTTVTVVEVKQDYILFSDGSKLYSEHDQDCCESHFLSMSDLGVKDFEGLKFNLEKDFFKRIVDYGIELIPTLGHSVKIPGYGSNNGYYSSNLTLVLERPKGIESFDISDCQEIDLG